MTIYNLHTYPIQIFHLIRCLKYPNLYVKEEYE